MKNILSEQQQKAVSDAVAAAEKKTSGEIVPYIVAKSGTYPETMWRGAVMGASLGMIVVLAIQSFYQGWDLAWIYSGFGVMSVVIVAGGLGAALSQVPGLKRMLAGGQITEQVGRRAIKAFVEQEVFDTRERTGILLFISLFERRIDVLGDTGINSKVSQDEWNGVVEMIKAGIKAGDLAGGLIEAIEMCGQLLEKSGVEIRDDDTDELSNEVRFSDE